LTSSIALIVPLLVWMTPQAAFSAEKVLLADYRPRPPEMVVDEKTGHFSRPLIDILEEAAHKVGYSIKWRQAPFQRSLKELELGVIDVVPRVVLDEERKAFVAYLGPIGYQEKDIVFLVRKGQENLISSYEDLKKITIGVKQDAFYLTGSILTQASEKSSTGWLTRLWQTSLLQVGLTR